jgi:hypothetical protein
MESLRGKMSTKMVQFGNIINRLSKNSTSIDEIENSTRVYENEVSEVNLRYFLIIYFHRF